MEMITGGVGGINFRNETFLNNVLYQDMNRATSWIKLLADEAHRNLESGLGRVRRPAEF